MKLIIAGSRTLNPSPQFINALICDFNLDTKITEIVSGTASGVDQAGERWCTNIADLCGKNAPILKYFPADWNTHGKAAGPIRNREMAQYADALLLIWDGKSSGSYNMKHEMRSIDKPIYEIIIKKENI